MKKNGRNSAGGGGGGGTTTPTGGGGTRRPSDDRRKALNDELTTPEVSNFFPLDRYYEVADKVYTSFQAAYTVAVKPGPKSQVQNAALDDAYVYGKRYCTFCLLSIPQHGYYGSVPYKSLQNKHTKQIQQVLDQLEHVANKMDEYEMLRIQRAAELARQAAEEKEQEELLRFAALQQRVESQKRNVGSDTGQVAASAMSKLQLLLPPAMPPPPSSPDAPDDDDRRIRKDPSGEEPLGQPSTKYSLMDEDDDEAVDGRIITPLPPPLLPNSPPPYHLAVQEGRRKGSNFWGPTPAAPPPAPINGVNSYSYVPPTAPVEHFSSTVPMKKPEKIPLAVLQSQYEQEYRRFVQMGKIRITYLDTYQGRVSTSTNGCTVISALVVAQHLQSPCCVTNQQISYVIDKQCGPVLREIRSKLGLAGHALIIPSDVHDHLVDCHLLPQDKFLGAAGGNILDKAHVGEFFKLLAAAPRQAAATLFFREHVISLVKYYTPDGGSAVNNNGTPASYYQYDLIDSLPSGPANTATRTICQGLEALIVLVRYYASRKFSSHACHYVDSNEWNDDMADVDPRVFQGFVWGEQAQ